MFPITNMKKYLMKIVTDSPGKYRISSNKIADTSMTVEKKLGIWMDHSSAHLIELTNNGMEERIIESKFTHDEKEASLNKSEYLMHNKEQHEQSDYYKKLGESIKPYKEVIIFGPTDAKSELLNVLRADHLFENIKIKMQPADKMTNNQQHAFVRNYFLKN
jgi:hypothetical protein